MPALPHDTGNPPAEQSERSENTWRPLGEVIAALMDEVNAAVAERDEAAAAEAHEALVQAEHEQRVIETVRRLGK